jgi:hypothetical protein
MPDDVKKVISRAHKVDKNKNGYWEAYYQDGMKENFAWHQFYQFYNRKL